MKHWFISLAPFVVLVLASPAAAQLPCKSQIAVLQQNLTAIQRAIQFRLGRIAEIQAEQRNPNLSPADRYSLAIQLHQQQVVLAQLVALRSHVIAAILALKKVCP